jgi:hypothetical protein
LKSEFDARLRQSSGGFSEFPRRRRKSSRLSASASGEAAAVRFGKFKESSTERFAFFNLPATFHASCRLQ